MCTNLECTHAPAGSRPTAGGWQEKVEGEMEPAPTPALEEARAMALQAATAAGQVQADCGLQVAPADFVAGALKWGLMEVLALATLPCELCSRVVQRAFSGQTRVAADKETRSGLCAS